MLDARGTIRLSHNVARKLRYLMRNKLEGTNQWTTFQQAHSTRGQIACEPSLRQRWLWENSSPWHSQTLSARPRHAVCWQGKWFSTISKSPMSWFPSKLAQVTHVLPFRRRRSSSFVLKITSSVLGGYIPTQYNLVFYHRLTYTRRLHTNAYYQRQWRLYVHQGTKRLDTST